jgi:translation initiation factor IF-3
MFLATSRTNALLNTYERITTIDTSHRVNELIRISPIRVVDQDGNMVGVIPTIEALQLATEAGMDLVEVAPTVRPPVCRIMDYGKFKYEQNKRKKDNSKQHQVQLKEIRLRPKTGEHDVDFKVKRARTFLEHKDKVKINVIFRGRENAHHERGLEMLREFREALEDIAKVEKNASMDSGRQMSMILAPKA